ncbi:MAG: PH domain-containing protein [Clostridium sp.]|uniref:PH domain-containing protein n=1 Tax=Clostridium sp. TaxID=1506 RepID=UPI003D6C9EB9
MKRISPFSRKMWALDGFISGGIFLIIAVILNVFLEFNALWKYILVGSIYGIVLLVIVYSRIMPKYKYEKFRYDIDGEKISLIFGVFSQRNVIIPMKRVQYVDTEQGIIIKRYNLINLTIHTAGGAYKIPFLGKEIGDKLQLDITNIVRDISI